MHAIVPFPSLAQTLKLWNLQKTIPAKKSASLDVEPVYTFRAHRGAVLSLDVAPAGDYVFSGGQDSTIRVWNMPNPNIDPYDAFDPSVLASTLTGKSFSFWHFFHRLIGLYKIYHTSSRRNMFKSRVLVQYEGLPSAPAS